jgi:predicted phosphoribosyltransferase
LSRVLFHDRVEAGRRLGRALKEFAGDQVIVLGIPRGGVVVANEIAVAIGARLDVVVAKKVTPPGEPEFALGAVGQEGEVVIDREAAESLGAGRDYLKTEIENVRREVFDRTMRFRGDRPFPILEGKTVVIVDDGIATGNSVEAAVLSVKKRGAENVVVAIPVAPREAVERLRQSGVRVVCLGTPEPFFAIGEFYEDFGQVADGEVKDILEEHWSRHP